MSKTSNLLVKNKTGGTIRANTVVYINGQSNDDDQYATIDLASNNSPNKMPAVGLVIDDIDHNLSGSVRLFGPMGGFNLANGEVNQIVYVGTDGGITLNKPKGQNEIVQRLGVVLNASDVEGQIYLFSDELEPKHAETHRPGEADEFIHASQHEVDGRDEIIHAKIRGLSEDDHQQYILADGSRSFSNPVAGVDPTEDAHFTTKSYITNLGIRINGNDLIIGPSNAMTIGPDGGIQVGSPSGGDQGPGTINANAVYDDGVILTCYVPEFVKDGKIDLNKWDKTIPNDKVVHAPARRFAANAKEELDPKKYSEKWIKNGHLPSMPSQKDWADAKNKIPSGKIIQGLWETVEVLAEHIRQLNVRIEEMERKNGR